MNNNIQIFNYNGANISFAQGEATMVNATEMARPFGKRPAKWLELPSTKEFLSKLAEVRKSDIGFVKTEKGGNLGGGGTWMHEDVALEFARWLSPEFAIWCNDRIKELMKIGFTATPQKLDELLSNPDLIIGLATQLRDERLKVEWLTKKVAYQQDEIIARKNIIKKQHEEILHSTETNRQLQRKNKTLTEKIAVDASKVDYYNQCAEMADDTLLSFRETAAMLNISERIFINTLLDADIIYRSKGKLTPYAKYLDKGFFRLVEWVNHANGYYYQTKITVKGRKYLNDNWERLSR